MNDMPEVLMEPEITTQQYIGTIADRAMKVVEKLRTSALRPDSTKRLDLRFGIEEAARLLGCSTPRIRDAEADGRLPPAAVSEHGRRLGYTIEDLWNMRDVLNASPRRPKESKPTILAVQNFKGGVGKSTITVHLAHYLAIQGYRLLVIDCDSQATTTTCFGLDPNLFVQQEETLYPFLSVDRQQESLHYAVQKTSWTNIDIIPSMQGLYDAEYELAATSGSGGSILLDRLSQLKQGVEEIAQDYDIVILDPPPALGTLSIAIMRAANSLLVPLAATMPDYTSTAKFLDMLSIVAGDLETAGVPMDMNFVNVICSKFNTNDKSQQNMLAKVLKSGFGAELMATPLLESAEISHALARWKSVYELPKPIGSTKTYKRCRENLDEAFSGVEREIVMSWVEDPIEDIVRSARA